MGLLRNIIIVVSAISFVTFVSFFGQLPALRKTPIGWLHRLLCIYAPSGLRKLDRGATGGQITRKSQRLGNYLFYEKNPVVLIIYLCILTGSASLFLWNTVYTLPTALLLPIPLLVALPYIFTYLAVSYKGHRITSATHSRHMIDYPYDHILFQPGIVCKTCDLVKPARSKHCSLCGYCIAKCDHHCPWINNCLGRGNYHWFLALLLSLGLVQIYGAYLSWILLRSKVIIDTTSPLFSWNRIESIGNSFVVAVNHGGLSIAGVGMLAASTAALPLGLLSYHLYLIWAGMTTNESQKWAEWKEDVQDGYVYKAMKQDLATHNRLRPKIAHGRDFHNPALSTFEDDGNHSAEDMPGSTMIDHVLVRTNDGRPPLGQERLWRRIWSLSDVENIYDRGGPQNFMDAFSGR